MDLIKCKPAQIMYKGRYMLLGNAQGICFDSERDYNLKLNLKTLKARAAVKSFSIFISGVKL